MKQDEQHHLHDKVMNANLSLENYVLSGLSLELRNWYTTHFSGLTIEEAEKEPEQAVTKATQIIFERYDIIGFLDNLEIVMAKVSEIAGFKRPFKNVSFNKTRSRPALDVIDERVIKTIAEVNFLDVRLYENLKKEERKPK